MTKKTTKTKKTTAQKKTAKKKAVKKATSKKAQKSSANKMPLLDATFEVLKKQAPLTCKELIERMTEAGLWKSEAATPANTLHAALSKEIRIKGKEARFEKVDRGRFSLKTV